MSRAATGGGALVLVLLTSLACSGVFTSAAPDWPSEVPEAPLAGVRSLEVEAARALQGESLPALALAVVHGGRLVAMGAAGQRVVGFDSPARATDRWHVGSVTKSMTATLVASMVASDGWSWDDPVAAAFPEVAAHPAWGEITVRDLLTHRAGVPEIGLTHLVGWRMDDRSTTAIRRAWATEEVLIKPPTEARGRMVYSNAGYVLLGAVIEARTGRTWEALVEERVFRPLGLSTAGFGAPAGPHQPWGHAPTLLGGLVAVEPGVWADNPAAMGPAGTVHLGLPELARYAAEHLAVLQGHPTVLTHPAYAELHHPPEGQDYAAGWVVGSEPWSEGPVVWHNGSNTMWYALVMLVPKLDLALVCTSNAMQDGRAEEVCQEALRGLGEDPTLRAAPVGGS
jgi:D-alanyl-D-alanine carboxypeptidase